MTEQAAGKSLTLRIEQKGDEAVVHCSGHLVAGVTGFLSSKVCPLIPEKKRIVLDLTELTHIDSMGLGTLVRLFCSAKAAGCRLELINLGKQVRELLGITNLLSVLTGMCEQGVTLRL
ncbi:MAG TPA: STAS domain-containing protein [Acidobacteriaceae bacterium]|nr:STAS domain-containing protein [Acidobacteriaceae bacterium]